MTLFNRDHERCLRESIWRKERSGRVLSLNGGGGLQCVQLRINTREINILCSRSKILEVVWFENHKERCHLKGLSETRGRVVLVLN
jgi:hypothetical protein